MAITGLSSQYGYNTPMPRQYGLGWTGGTMGQPARQPQARPRPQMARQPAVQPPPVSMPSPQAPVGGASGPAASAGGVAPTTPVPPTLPSMAGLTAALGQPLDAISGGVGNKLRGDLGNRTPPSLTALMQGLRY